MCSKIHAPTRNDESKDEREVVKVRRPKLEGRKYFERDARRARAIRAAGAASDA